MAELTDLVMDYKRDSRNLNQVVGAVCEAVYRYPLGKSGFSEDDCAAFLLRFYPRISRLVKRFRYEGTSFEAYLNTTLRYQLRTYARERGTEKIHLSTETEHAVAMGIDSREPTTPYRYETDRECHRARRALKISSSEARRLLFIMLKGSEHLSDSACLRFAELVGCEPEWLAERWQELRKLFDRHRARRRRAEQVRDRAWFKVRCAESRLNAAVDREEINTWQQERERWNVRLARARETLNRLPAGPTHRQIAEVLGMPKGTVDSGVFKARKQLARKEYRDRLASLVVETYSLSE